MDLLTARQVGDALGKSPETVRHHAKTHGIGEKVGRDWLFTADEVERIRNLPGPGRPRRDFLAALSP